MALLLIGTAESISTIRTQNELETFLASGQVGFKLAASSQIGGLLTMYNQSTGGPLIFRSVHLSTFRTLPSNDIDNQPSEIPHS